jgi:ribosomal protein S18 acetylase RimI-like enzyme
MKPMGKGNYVIRDYRDSDKNELLRQYRMFGEYLASADDLKRYIVGEKYAETLYKKLMQNTAKNHGRVLVVEGPNKKLIGFAACDITYLTPEDTQESVPTVKGCILELFIEEQSRGLGIGKDLMQKMEDYLKENKVDVVNIEVFAPNKPAYNFYKKFGYSDRNYDLMKVL